MYRSFCKTRERLSVQMVSRTGIPPENRESKSHFIEVTIAKGLVWSIGVITGIW